MSRRHRLSRLSTLCSGAATNRRERSRADCRVRGRMSRRNRVPRVVAVITVVTTIIGGPGFRAAVSAQGTSGECHPSDPATCTLADLADLLGIRIGTTLEDFEIVDSDYVATLRREFTSVTPENALKAYSIRPTQSSWDFSAGDAVVDYSVDAGLEIRGHTLVWAKDEYTPAWLAGLTDPVALWTATQEHVTQVMSRYADRVRRWDVVNEPLATLGTGPSDSVFWSLAGDWIGDVFRLADSIDPTAELWINEYGTDWVPGKHAAYLSLVRDLVESDVPIDGVGLQVHRLPGSAVDQALLEQQLRDFTSLGLQVAVTELDVPVAPTDPRALEWQASQYRKVMAACLAVSGCREVTVWGLSDRDTWLDGLGVFSTPTRPLLFDDSLRPKPAYTAVRDLMAQTVVRRSLPTTGGFAGSEVLTAWAILTLGVALVMSTRRPRRTS